MTKILQHISHAREWLKEAEKKLRNDNAVEGELFLSLAEAEIHKAWENSMSSRQEKKVTLFDRLKNNNLSRLLMVIALIVILVLAGFNYYGTSPAQPSLELSLPRERNGLSNSFSGGLHRGEIGLISNNLSLEY